MKLPKSISWGPAALLSRAARLSGYVAWFLVAFVVGVYLTFPLQEMKGLFISIAEEQLGKGSVGRYGHEPNLEIGSLALSGFGVKAEDVQLQLASHDPEPGPVLTFDAVQVGIRPWTLVTAAKTVTLDADLYGGNVDAVLSIDDKYVVHDADIDIEGIDLSQVPMFVEKLGLPVTGLISASAQLELGPTPEKDGEGEIKLALSQLSTKPGKLLPVMGFEIPFGIDAGTLTAEIPVKQGRGTLNGLKLDGKDLQAELMGEILFRGRLMSSRLDIDGWLYPTPAFVEREKIEPLLGFAGQTLGRAKDEEGHYWFSLRGALSNPQAALSRDAGRRAKQKAGRKGGDTPPPDAPPGSAG